MKKGILITAIFLIVIAAFLAAGQIFCVRHVNVVFENKTGITDESEVISVIGLDRRNNIFSVNEREVKQKVAAHYVDNAIVVTDVVRSFPDTVTVYVKERTPILKIKVYSPTEELRYVPTDKDFQRGTVYDAGDPALSMRLIEVTGLEVVDTFDKPEFVLLRSVLNTFVSFGFEEAALPYFFTTANVDDDEETLSLTVSGTGAKFVVGKEANRQLISDAYQNYLALDQAQRIDKIYLIGVPDAA